MHPSPDLDSLFSNFVFAQILKKLGKQVVILGGDDWKEVKNFSQFSEYISDILPCSISEYREAFDLLLVLDINRPARVSKNYQKGNHQVIIFDHHMENSFPCDDNHLIYVDEYASSTCEMIVQFCQVNSLKLDEQELKALYAGIYSDSMGFTSATSEKTLQAAAFIKSQINPDDMVQKIERVWTVNDFINLPAILTDFESVNIFGEKVALLVTDSNTISIKKLQNFLMKSDSDLLVIAIKVKDGFYRISFLSHYDVSYAVSQRLAKKFNGNGHANRAGGYATNVSKDELKELLKQEICLILKK